MASRNPVNMGFFHIMIFAKKNVVYAEVQRPSVTFAMIILDI